jgi:uncharacterized protein YhaN
MKMHPLAKHYQQLKEDHCALGGAILAAIEQHHELQKKAHELQESVNDMVAQRKAMMVELLAALNEWVKAGRPTEAP